MALNLKSPRIFDGIFIVLGSAFHSIIGSYKILLHWISTKFCAGEKLITRKICRTYNVAWQGFLAYLPLLLVWSAISVFYSDSPYLKTSTTMVMFAAQNLLIGAAVYWFTLDAIKKQPDRVISRWVENIFLLLNIATAVVIYIAGVILCVTTA